VNYDLVAEMLDGIAQQARVDADSNFEGDDQEALYEAARAVHVLAKKCRDGDSLDIPFGFQFPGQLPYNAYEKHGLTVRESVEPTGSK